MAYSVIDYCNGKERQNSSAAVHGSPLYQFEALFVASLFSLSKVLGMPERDVHGFPWPSFVLFADTNSNVGGSYCFPRNEISVLEHFSVSWGIVGEEAAHYLHHQLNPACGTWPNSVEADAIKETVGGYGRLINGRLVGFSAALDQHRLALPSHFDIWRRAPFSLEAHRKLQGHRLGYQWAERLYSRHGDGAFEPIVRMNLEEAIEKIPRLALQ